MRRSRRDDFFAGVMIGRRSLLRDYRDPVWEASSGTLAEIFLFDKYRQGVHPDYVEWEVRQELAMTTNRGYNYYYLRALLDMHARLRRAGSFYGLPSLAELDAERILDKRIRLEQMIKDRFMRQNMETMLRRNTGNSQVIDHDIPQGRHRKSNSRSDENDSLHRTVADLAFRVESAEARLDTQSQTSKSRRSNSTDYYHGNGCDGNHMPMPQQAQMQGAYMGDGLAQGLNYQRSMRGGIDDRGQGQVVVYSGPRSNMGDRGYGPNYGGYDQRSQNNQSMQNGGRSYGPSYGGYDRRAQNHQSMQNGGRLSHCRFPQHQNHYDGGRGSRS